MWVYDFVSDLFRDAAFLSVFGVSLVFYAAYYPYKLSKESILQPQLRPYTDLTHLTTSILIIFAFVSIGPFTISPRFQVLFWFSILQFFVYSILSFVLISDYNKRMRIMCVKVFPFDSAPHQFLIRAWTSLSLLILGIWVHYSFILATTVISNDTIQEHINNKTLVGLINALVGSNLIVIGVHAEGVLLEMIFAFVGIGGQRAEKKKYTKVDFEGKEVELSYEVTSEI
ncbi:Hypothetical_protein [Hexamita inflata]|uniref:Hypothetical_protein n=1 Tax=Hexamita inflata TaxID=28002 RepID=A0ABP1HRU3_9EUKA